MHRWGRVPIQRLPRPARHSILLPSTTLTIPSSSYPLPLGGTRSHSTKKETYHLQSTRIPTFHFQKSLPRLPIPKLEDTLRRYKAAVEPICTSQEEFQETVAALDAFGKGAGAQLDAQLRARDEQHKHTSYINEWWFEMYVENRQPLVINSNPQIRLRDDPQAAKNTPLQRATSLISSTLKFFCSLRDGTLKPDIYHLKPTKTDNNLFFDTVCRVLPETLSYYGAYAQKAYPLDMSQYRHLFRSTRVPHLNRDELVIGPTDARHIVVQRGRDFYAVDVLEENGRPVADTTLAKALKWVLDQPLQSQESAHPGVGYFTTLDRDTWAQARAQLLSTHHVNVESLATIDSALFMVCLEHTSPNTTVDLNRCFLHSDGENRWFDKSFQLIVAANGKAAVNFEHSWGDGVAVLRCLNEVYQDSVKGAPVVLSTLKLKKPPKRLRFELSPTIVPTLMEARRHFDMWRRRLHVVDVELEYDRAYVGETLGVGIDGFLQMAIQLGHYRLHHNFVATYESASTAAFKHGRTETVRSCTREAVAFVRCMSDPKASVHEQNLKLRQAITVHNALTKQGVLGQGCDRHLFALRKMWDENQPSAELPQLFALSTWHRMNRIILSTSTLSSPNLEGGGFGPVNDACYGVGYGMEERTVFQLATYRPDAQALATCLRTSVEDMVAVLAKTNT